MKIISLALLLGLAPLAKAELPISVWDGRPVLWVRPPDEKSFHFNVVAGDKSFNLLRPSLGITTTPHGKAEPRIQFGFKF